ncbi:U2 small nuclear ribonucleoprotein auxiliary factor 35 kDa subunit-related protein 1-like [Myxocyprinus asiaticus]|uniref:U2 small nuclear ribonucleoprotein auxiliary factor 35 kDa subunit-related protein 1-like n=1 Tax=Myxocyprinus asiaticus TaxID=70543 RepID=UPI00222142A6|nr:U2 small nuclear ribonucleoprotein auxiliary factor 35 kDa subunit-related protein 1-like [Myxocyprinus asiaticus]
MAHGKRFAQIPMSKCMRDICKEEDYAFLNSLGKQDKSPEDNTFQESEWQDKKEERVHRCQEREQLERERQLEIDEQRKEKQEKWKSHVAELAVQREAIHAKLHRLREFRDFQKKVLLQDLGQDPGSTNETINHLLMRL